ncbi:MAG: hypothetical protein JSV49_04355 [Thermoplasmata archaeon]|nr:MAG: hypothetical protein JSV49_04355 [Thermoplasmata archaeon]
MTPQEDLPVRRPINQGMSNNATNNFPQRAPRTTAQYSAPQQSVPVRMPVQQEQYGAPQQNVPVRMPAQQEQYSAPQQSAPLRMPPQQDEYSEPEGSVPVRKPREPKQFISSAAHAPKTKAKKTVRRRPKLRPIPKRDTVISDTAATSPRKPTHMDFRYRTRIFKGSILPLLYGFISIRMLNEYVLEYPDYFQYEITMILGGFLLGLISISGITLMNLFRAKRNRERGCNLSLKLGFITFLPFLIILLGLAFFIGISTAWQFSTGFFLTPIFPLLFVTILEVNSKGKFFVREMGGESSRTRKLIFIK